MSLAYTAAAITSTVFPVFCLYNPVDREEELTAHMTDEQKTRFQEAISDLAYDAINAIDNDDREEASKLWRRQLGERLPNIKKAIKIGQEQEDAAKLAAAYGAKNPPKPWVHS